MKIKFKKQNYQTDAVEAVADCFTGQPKRSGLQYRIDPGVEVAADQRSLQFEELAGFKNPDIEIPKEQLLKNIQAVQRRQNLPQSKSLADFKTIKKDKLVVDNTYTKKALSISSLHLDIEMETGTGKTYCYIKTMFELNARYGWSKFIVVVPSIAIREGVHKSFEMTADHFLEDYGKRARFFIYNSKDLPNLESFSSDSGINVMIINVQAFNATGKDARRIYEELDDFQSRKPIDVIQSNKPILILDEPQKMEGKKTVDSMAKFNPLMILRYSATHKTEHNKIHRLDALDAYNQKLVKKIAVRGISVKRVHRNLGQNDNLYDLSGGLDQYKGFVISDIDAVKDTVSFTNGVELQCGEATGDVNELALRRIQIREAIRAHFEKEQRLFSQGIKVLSLFFIDEVVKYRDYDQADEKGEYARVFEEEYDLLKAEYLSELAIDNEAYRKHLAGIDVSKTHNGYFSIDKKTSRLKDPDVGARAVDSDDVDSYDLILKDKRELSRLRKWLAEGNLGHAFSAAASGDRGLFHRQDHSHRCRAGRDHARLGEANLSVSGQE